MEETLAIFGGQPTVQEPFPATNNIGVEEKAAAMRVMERGVLSDFLGRAGDKFLGGAEVRQLENAFCQKFGTRFAVAFNSATTALEAAVAALGIEPGGEVIVPPYTMTASVMAIVVNNLVPVFADVDPVHFSLDLGSVASRITPKTKAIMAVNLFGGTPRYDELMSLALKHGLKVIEDNAQAAGGMYHGKYAGTIGDMGVFSLNVHKTIQVGEGGVLITNDEALAWRAQLKRNHGENIADDTGKHDVPIAGSNYRMSELHAAVATEQLAKLDFLNQERIALADYLTERLAGIPGITPYHRQEDTVHAYYLYPIRYDAKAFGVSRDVFVRAMQAEGVPIAGGYVKPIYLLNFFQDESTRRFWPHIEARRYGRGLCPMTEQLFFDKLLTTNVCRHPLTRHHVDLFASAVRKIWQYRGRLETLK